MKPATTGKKVGVTSQKYEKYILRRAKPGDPKVNWGRPDLGVVVPQFFLAPHIPVLRESNAMFEYLWVTKDAAFGVTNDRGPHAHDCPELFLFFGTNPKDPDDLGGEVEFWMGEGADLEKVKINTTSLVYVPKGLLHLPLFFRNVKRPILHVVVGLEIGDSLAKTRRYPPRNT
jgi:hypothetical protein